MPGEARMTTLEKLYIIVASAAIGGVLGYSLGHAEDLTNVIYQWCYDADTCSFDILPPTVLNADIRVRFAGIDAPEINGRCAKEKQLAIEARDFVRAQLRNAHVVLKDVARDKYYRIDATVMVNGVNLNQLLIEKGYAVPYVSSGERKDWCAP
jgi:endonuclease YncB( thermonuclease family)